MVEPLILIVEDEKPVVDMLQYNLETEGYRILSASDGEQALLIVKEESPSLLILDWMLPGISGLEICRRLKRAKDTRNIPILMLTARGEETDMVRALNIGADDYVVKPFSLTLLIARIRAIFRRTNKELSDEKLELEHLKLYVDTLAHRVWRGPTEVHLGPIEYRLLCYFMANPGRVYSREQILDSVWGRNRYVEPRTVDVHVRRLRRTLNVDGSPDIIRTVRSAGYSLNSS
tara:strand:+ start:621 stop:1316 length:696 start_codon:yes stop_codon:yes gene_type:complete